ncbi:MAG: hypoxanthine phosphoribosyltransferase [Oscillospiraceae bacterium]|nr:hypoxanthine phosphoribosyltransferase [Oscillospiraceae bacterium]
MRQDIESILLSAEELKAGIEKLGKTLTEDYRGKEPVVVGILRGVVPFYATLTQNMDVPMVQDFMSISSYHGTQTTGEIRFKKDLDVSIQGRHVLILEDIVDSGLTLKKVVEELKIRNPASIKVCTLLDKPSGRKVEFQPDYCCFTIPDGFVVGFGLDYNDHYRNLPYVGILKKEVYSD